MDEELYFLIRKLRDESTFVQSERKHLIELFKQVIKKSEQLFHKQWIITRQHLILDDLIIGRNKLSSAQICSKFSLYAEKTDLIESHKVLENHDYQVGEFLKQCREKPALLAPLLVKSEKYSIAMPPQQQLVAGVDNQQFSTQQILGIVFQSLYSNCILAQDELYFLKLLRSIMEIQFGGSGSSSDPSITNGTTTTSDFRRIIRKQSCSFNILFKFYITFSFSAQLFLTAALYEPVSQILTQEWYLDIDPDKALARFTTDELTNRFGSPNSKEFKAKTQKYREKIVNELYTAAMSIIDSISSNLFCFPTPLAWLVNQLYQIVNKTNGNQTNSNKSSQNHQEMARKLCCDLIMALYVCPAICDPEPYGVISDIQMSVYARHNLMQIANILQVLAMSDDDKDAKAQDLYSKFRNNCVSDILNGIILTQNHQNRNRRNNTALVNLTDAQTLSKQDSTEQENSHDPNQFFASMLRNSSTQSNLNRTSIFISQNDINKLIIYFKCICKENTAAVGSESEEVKWMKSILPLSYISQMMDESAAKLNAATAAVTVAAPRHNSLTPNSNSNNSQNLKSKVYTSESGECILAIIREPNFDARETIQVLVVNINDKSMDCPGMLSEEKVLGEVTNSSSSATVALKSRRVNTNSGSNNINNSNNMNCISGNNSKSKLKIGGGSGSSSKRITTEENDALLLDSSFGAAGSAKIRSCLSSETGGRDDRDEIRSRHDGSVEGISEVCETNDCRSISSNDDDDDNNDDDDAEGANRNDELENQMADDCLSEFDYLSGRDTPIISGRDTPSSHSHEDLQMNTSANRSIMNANQTAAGLNDQQQQMSGSINSTLLLNSNNLNSGSVGSNLASRGGGLQLPVTVQKTNREDINEKFCKFEINKISAPVKEEQLSEAWSLDADPPESVNNEPINDQMSTYNDADSSTSTSAAAAIAVGNSNTLRSSNVNRTPSLPNSNAIAAPAGVKNANTSINSNAGGGLSANSSSANLINFDQDPLPNNNNNNNAASASNRQLKTTTTDTTTMTKTSIKTNSAANELAAAPSATAADNDYLSVVSDSAASMNADLINNNSEESDLESNSPSKYTPYSTYSSYSGIGGGVGGGGGGHAIRPSIINNSNLINSDFNTAANNNTDFLNSSYSATTAASASTSITATTTTNSLLKSNIKSVDSGLNSWNYSTAEKSNESSNASPSNNGSRNRITSIFSNTGSVKFSLGSNNNQNQKRTGIQRIFNLKPSSNKQQQQQQQQQQPSSPSSTQQQLQSSDTNSPDVDNILKKYANKSNAASVVAAAAPLSAVTDSEAVLIDLSTQSAFVRAVDSAQNNQQQQQQMANNFSLNSSLKQQQDDGVFYDPAANVEALKQFQNAKKKLRIVLSWSDCLQNSFMPFNYYRNSKENFLSMYLKSQLYEAIGLQDKEKEAKLYEAIRCIGSFNDQDCHKLLRSLRKDYLKRVAYLTYLTKSKQNVLYSLNLIEKLLKRAEWHQKLCTHHLASVITRLFLEPKNVELYKFVYNFRQIETLDEKFQSFKECLQTLKHDFDHIWLGCSDEMLRLGHLYLERLLMSKVYTYAMFPNGELDHFRDQKVQECFSELGSLITPSHPLIGIPDIYHQECPWTAAQMELRRLNIYKTPQDKLACIKKCMLTIQNLLAIAKSPVCADDMHPVLIYVIIKANPPTFLSNVQYVEGFFGSQLESEDYYWAQFIFAYSYIKAKMLTSLI